MTGHHLNVERVPSGWKGWCDCQQWETNVVTSWYAGRRNKGEFGRELTDRYREHVAYFNERDKRRKLMEQP